MRPVQVDPPGCGCTECITGEYVPLDRATASQVRAMLGGRLRDATGEEFSAAVLVTTSWSGLSWEWELGP